MGLEMLDKALNEIQKPARYIGGELNSVVKDFEKTPQTLKAPTFGHLFIYASVVLNSTDNEHDFSFRISGYAIFSKIEPHSISTYIFTEI